MRPDEQYPTVQTGLKSVQAGCYFGQVFWEWHLVWQKSKSRARNSRQRPCPICSVTTAPCPALHKPTAFGHSHFPLICGSSLPITGGLHTTLCLSVPSDVFSWLPSSPYLLTLLRTPHQEFIIPAFSSIFQFFNLSTQEWPCFFLKDNHEELSRNSLLQPLMPGESFSWLLPKPLVIPPTDSWLVWCQLLPRPISLSLQRWLG